MTARGGGRRERPASYDGGSDEKELDMPQALAKIGQRDPTSRVRAKNVARLISGVESVRVAAQPADAEVGQQQSGDGAGKRDDALDRKALFRTRMP